MNVDVPADNKAKIKQSKKITKYREQKKTVGREGDGDTKYRLYPNDGQKWLKENRNLW